jgi:hypothetical protein
MGPIEQVLCGHGREETRWTLNRSHALCHTIPRTSDLLPLPRILSLLYFLLDENVEVDVQNHLPRTTRKNAQT